MRAVIVAKQGLTALKLSQSSVPNLGSHDILVKNTFSGLNFIDTYQASGLYQMSTPFVLGVEGVGTIEAVGQDVNISNFASNKLFGKKVVYFSQGSYAQFTVVNQEKIATLPEEISEQVACALTIQGLTAHMLVNAIGNLGKGNSCLVHACAGGTGRLLSQIAKIKGATVIGTCSSKKMAFVDGLVDHVIDYSSLDEQSLAQRVRSLSPGKAGVDVVFDGVGKSTYLASLNSVKKRGLVCFFGNASGPVPPIAPLDLTARGSIFMTRPTLGDYISCQQDIQQALDDLCEWYLEGKLEVTIDKIFDLEEVEKAHKYILAGETKGKVLLRVPQ